MEIYHGIAAHPGVAIAAAARLHTEFGAPSLAPERMRRLGERLRRFGVEAPEDEHVVLVAESVPPGFLLSPIPGLQFAGVAAESPAPLVPPPRCPAVLGLDRAFFSGIEEEEIVIVDGNRGRVYVAPDAGTVARYQAPFTLARRIFLEGVHLPARTASDSRHVAVLSTAPTLQAVSEAMAAGADGILVPAKNDFIGGPSLGQTAGEQAAALMEVAGMIGGQRLMLHVPTERLALSALSRAAAACPLTVILDDPDLRPELGDRLQEIESIQEEQDVLFGTVFFDLSLRAAAEFEAERREGFAGVVIDARRRQPREALSAQLAAVPPDTGQDLTVILPRQGWRSILRESLRRGATRVICSTDAVIDVKDAIRES